MTNKDWQIIKNWQEELESCLLESKALCIAVLSVSQQIIIYSNTAFQQLAGTVSPDAFRNPSLEKLLDMAKDQHKDKAPLFEGLLTIGTASDSTTIQGKIFGKGDELLVTGEVDIQRIISQNRHMSSLNREISNLQRQLTKEKVLLESTLEELQEKNEKLAIMNEEKNRFMNMAAHDLRNPIATAISFTDILLHDEDAFPEETKTEFLKNIEERLNYAIQMMTELLDVSKIEAGTMQLNTARNDYLELVRKAVSFNQLVGGYKDIVIHGAFDKDNPLKFHFDKNKMEQVLNNLISNAIKYSHHGSEITVRVEQHPDRVETAVIDEGQGIPADEIAFLFKPFQKTSTRPTAGESSTGLGLAICKKIVEEHQGEITVQSTEGKGSVFRFTLPFTQNLGQPQTSNP